MLKRKILTAMVASLIFALIFMMDSFSMNGFLNLFYLNLMIVITYGVSTSVFSDWLSKKMTERTYAREIISFLLKPKFRFSIMKPEFLHLFILSLAVSLPVDFADHELRGVIQRDVDPSYVFSDQPQHEHDHSADEQDNGH